MGAAGTANGMHNSEYAAGMVMPDGFNAFSSQIFFRLLAQLVAASFRGLEHTACMRTVCGVSGRMQMRLWAIQLESLVC